MSKLDMEPEAQSKDDSDSHAKTPNKSKHLLNTLLAGSVVSNFSAQRSQTRHCQVSKPELTIDEHFFSEG